MDNERMINNGNNGSDIGDKIRGNDDIVFNKIVI